MGSKHQILAARYPFSGYYEELFQCQTLWVALTKFREYKRRGYEIIDIHFRDFKKQFTWAGE